jgi:hypothetical protein
MHEKKADKRRREREAAREKIERYTRNPRNT